MKRKVMLWVCLAMTAIALMGCGKNSSAIENSEQTERLEESKKGNADRRYDTYTIYFDANTTPDDLTDDESFSYWTTGWNSQKKKSIVTYKATDDAYILSDDVPTPTRKGYYFAGWQTVPVVEDTDIVNGVSKYQVFFDTKISSLGEDALKNKTDEEIQKREIEQDVNYIKDMENLTEDGSVTFYARWVEAKEIASEEDLKNIANDLYGAYALTSDITLTEEWEPIGKYFTNYEYFNVDWWTYAFRGTLDGNGHSISGLKLEGGQVENPGYYTMSDARWYKDGPDCNGAAGLFGAACKATFKNLVIDSPVIDITGEKAYAGDHLYASALCCFDMGSAVSDVKVINPVIHVEYTDEQMIFSEALFAAVAGLEAGSWSTTISGCSIEGGLITVDYTSNKSHGAEVYVGGMLGECYASIKNSSVDTKITVNGKDSSTVETDLETIVNVGGFGGANASAQTSSLKADINVDIVKEKGASSVNVGGFAGAQRYQQILTSDIQANITSDCKLDEVEGNLNVGAIIGRMDLFYATLILKYADEVKCGCSGNTVSTTYQGQVYDILMSEGGYPIVDGKRISYVATKDFSVEDTGESYSRNLDQVAENYGTYLPKEGLDKKIMYIIVE